MQKLVLLVVGAVWLAVLVPPLLRSRGEGRPNSSVDHFRKHLAILQKTAPSRMSPMQSVGRPLAGGRPAADPYAKAAVRRPGTDPRLRRVNYQQGRQQPQAQQRPDDTRTLQRRAEAAARPRSRQTVQRQRREQIVRFLFVCSIGSAILAFLAKSPMLIYMCAFFVLSLLGYCSMLLRMRRDAELYAMDPYSRAA